MMVFLICFIYLSFIGFALSLFNKVKLPNSIVVFLLALETYVLLVITHNVKLTSYVVYGSIILLFLAGGLVLLLKKKDINKRILLDYIKVECISLIFTVVLFIFSNYYLSEFVSLLPLSGATERLALLQNIYHGNTIYIDCGVDALTILFSIVFSLFKGMDEFTLVSSYLNNINLLFIYLIVELVIQLWLKNIKNNKSVLNCGLVIFFALTYTFAFLKFGILTYLWAIFPIAFCFLFLWSPLKAYVRAILSLISSLFVFCLGLDFKLSLIVSFISVFFICINFCEHKFPKKLKRIFIFCLLLSLGISYFVFYFIHSGFGFIDGYIKTNISNVFIPYFDITIPTWIISLILISLALLCLKRDNASRCSIVVFLVITIVLNPFLLEYLQQFNHYQIILYLIFNPLLLMKLFEIVPNEYTNKALVCIVCACGIVVSNKFIINPYYESEKSNYDLTTRIPNEEMEIYKRIQNTRTANALKIISQAPYTQAFVPGAVLHENYSIMANRCQYCDVFALELHQPNNLVNCYQVREFPGNQVFIESPDYNQLKELTYEFAPDYLIIKTDQVIEVNGNWYKMYEYLGNFFMVDLVTENYALLVR